MKSLRVSRMVLVVTILAMLTSCDLWVSTRTRLARADQYFAQADYRRAMIELKNVLDSEPANQAALSRAAATLWQLGDVNGAEKELKAAEGAGMTPADASGLHAEIDLAEGKFNELIAGIKAGQIVLAEPARSVYRGQALLGLKQYSQATEAFRAAMARDADSIAARVGLAETLVAGGDTGAALRALDAVVANQHGAADAWRVRAMIYLQLGRFADAEADLLHAKDHAVGQLTLPQQAAVLASLTETRLALGKIQDAEASQADLAKVAPGAVITQYLAGRIAMARQDYSGAVNVLQELVTASPKYVPAKFLLGAALLAQGSLNQAEKELEEVHQLAPENLEARKLLAEVRMRLNRPGDAEAVLTPALVANPEDSQLISLSAAATALGKGPAAAMTQVEKLAADPANISARLLLARHYLKTQQTDKADRLLTETVAAAPRRADVLSAVGMLYMETGRYDHAVGQLRSAVELDGENSGYWLNLGRAELALNQPQAALAAFSTSLERRPDWLPAVSAMTLMDLRSGNSNAALARVLAAQQSQPTEAGFVVLEGDVRAILKQYPEASIAYDRANALRPASATAIKAYRAKVAARLPDAVISLERWVQTWPKDSVVRAELAGAYITANQDKKAIGEYEAIQASGAPSPTVLNNLAWLYQKTGDARALDTARKAYAASPKQPQIADTYGWVLVQSGQVAAGRKILDAAAALAPDDALIQQHDAEALERERQGH
jgi:cellulose synthase operon protein C